MQQELLSTEAARYTTDCDGAAVDGQCGGAAIDGQVVCCETLRGNSASSFLVNKVRCCTVNRCICTVDRITIALDGGNCTFDVEVCTLNRNKCAVDKVVIKHDKRKIYIRRM